MQKLAKVEAARALMIEAMSWSVMKWLREKRSVRRAADAANAALDQQRLSAQEQWTENLKSAYQALVAAMPARNHSHPQVADREATTAAVKIKAADDEASRARADAEETFDQAEKQLSTSLAREGCRKAIYSWDLHEKAIREAEARNK